jgi:hydrogenase maturation protease
MTRSDAAERDQAWAVDTLVIGYGNTLRRDDALGVRAAEAIEALGLAGVRVLTTTQLVPELAAPASEARRVVFVDARVDEPGAGVIVRRLTADGRGPADAGMTHAASPELLMHAAEHVFGRRPEACVVSIPAEDFGFGEGLSPQGERWLEEAIRRILELLEDR